MIEMHPYDGRISGETGINARNTARIEANCREKKSIRFAFMGDSQRWFDETGDFVRTVNKRGDIDFVIHGGDIADFGLTKEYMWMRDAMNRLDMPYVVILGNHDCLANGKEIFNTVFGDENFSFIAGDTKFVCLNTNALEHDYSCPVPDFGFIENELAKEEEYAKTVVAMHVRPLLSGEFNNNVAPIFQYMIKQFPGLQFCLNAHDHSTHIVDIFDDGIIYYGTACIGKRSFFIFTLHRDNTYDYEVVEF
jgi:3',5'-cyclic AMP phosphodiesterase CpdA